MKNLVIAAIAASSITAAAPAFAADGKTSADPFVSTQGMGALGLGGGAAVVAGTFVLITALASSGTD